MTPKYNMRKLQSSNSIRNCNKMILSYQLVSISSRIKFSVVKLQPIQNHDPENAKNLKTRSRTETNHKMYNRELGLEPGQKSLGFGNPFLIFA